MRRPRIDSAVARYPADIFYLFSPADQTGHSRSIRLTTTLLHSMCYFVAKQLDRPCSVEEYAIALGRKFVSEYPLVSAAIIEVDQKPWQRVSVDGEAHNHGE